VKRLWTWPALALVCGCAVPARPDRHASAIVNGQAEDQYPATLYLYNTAGVACTGTLIASRVVLTAKHCIASVPEDGWVAAVGPVGEVAQVPVTEVTSTDGVQTDNVDVALMVLAEDPGPAPVAFARDFGAHAPGETLTLVGYGDTGDGTLGRKSRTIGDLAEVKPNIANKILNNEFLITANSTNARRNDSGGPLFDENDVQVGLMVRANVEQDCAVTDVPCVTVGLRIDRFLDLIDATIAAADGGGAVDPRPSDPLDLGEPCVDGSGCSSALCEEGFCTSRCDLVQGEACPAGFYCDARGSCGEGRCAPGEPGSGRVGERCSRDLECATRLCAVEADGGEDGRCAVPCDPGAEHACGSGAACVEVAGGCGACLDDADLGAACTAPTDCGSGLCEDGVCSAACPDGAACPAGFVCEQALCLPSGGQLGDACDARGDCATGLCGHASGSGDGGLCTRSCVGDEVCGEGFRCARSTGETGACWPVDAADDPGPSPAGGLVGESCASAPGMVASNPWHPLAVLAIALALPVRRRRRVKRPAPPSV